MPDGIVKIKLGGKDYTLRAELEIAPRIEAETGKGIFAVAREVPGMSATSTTVATILAIALEVNGHTLDRDAIYKAMAVEGLAAAYGSAGAILFELISPPKKAKSKNGVAVPAPN